MKKVDVVAVKTFTDIHGRRVKGDRFSCDSDLAARYIGQGLVQKGPAKKPYWGEKSSKPALSDKSAKPKGESK